MLLVGTVPASDKQHKPVERKHCPAPSHVFTGRADILSSVNGHFSSDSTNKRLMFVLYGLGGSGKSEIMRQFVADSQVQTDDHPPRSSRSVSSCFCKDFKFPLSILLLDSQKYCMSTPVPKRLLKSISQTYPWRNCSDKNGRTPSTGLFVLGTIGFSSWTMPTTQLWICDHISLPARTEIS